MGDESIQGRQMLHSRDRRVGEAIRQSLSLLFQGEVRDPRVPAIVTITHVEVTRDLRTAKVYYSQMPDDDEAIGQMEDFLREARGFLRARVGEDVNIKFAPDLHFRYDPSSAQFDRINRLLHQIRGRDGDG